MPKYDGWEPLLDDRNPPREKMLGSGGQGVVYLARSPGGVGNRINLQWQAKSLLIHVAGGQPDPTQLARCLCELGNTNQVEDLGALKHFRIPP